LQFCYLFDQITGIFANGTMLFSLENDTGNYESKASQRCWLKVLPNRDVDED
jgi:hypothetical protein